jgi:fatty acid desaturase
MTDATKLTETPAPRAEWPTVALLFVCYGSWLALTWFHAALALWIWLPWAAFISVLWGSLQHELLHGHPTRSQRLNNLLGAAPFWLWLPFARYRQSHLAHHRDERLTDPLDDPESRYWTPESWAKLHPVRRLVARAQATFVGYALVGPLATIPRYLADEARAAWRGDRTVRRAWAWHLVLLAPTLYWVFGICGVPAWLYLPVFSYFGLVGARVRSFAEHRAAAEIGHRTAIVENAWILGPLFLFNNLHVAHHRWPRMAWYRLPAAYKTHRDELCAANGGLVYDGYKDVFLRFWRRPHDAFVHPLGRAPLANGSHPGTM